MDTSDDTPPYSFDDIFNLNVAGISAQWLEYEDFLIYVNATENDYVLTKMDPSTFTTSQICNGLHVFLTRFISIYAFFFFNINCRISHQRFI